MLSRVRHLLQFAPSCCTTLRGKAREGKGRHGGHQTRPTLNHAAAFTMAKQHIFLSLLLPAGSTFLTGSFLFSGMGGASEADVVQLLSWISASRVLTVVVIAVMRDFKLELERPLACG